MAKSRNNVITHGLSGLIGDLLVFRQRAGKTIVSDRPKVRVDNPNPDQLEVRERFIKAAKYAKAAISDLTKKDLYQAAAKAGQSAYNVAFADYQKAPEIEANPNYSGYSGQIGYQIEATVYDNFMVAAVKVEIRDASNALIEQGEAVQQDDVSKWIYETTVANPAYATSSIIIKAYDMPENETIQVTQL
jgi:hypothetical protein